MVLHRINIETMDKEINRYKYHINQIMGAYSLYIILSSSLEYSLTCRATHPLYGILHTTYFAKRVANRVFKQPPTSLRLWLTYTILQSRVFWRERGQSRKTEVGFVPTTLCRMRERANRLHHIPLLVRWNKLEVLNLFFPNPTANSCLVVRLNKTLRVDCSKFWTKV